MLPDPLNTTFPPTQIVPVVFVTFATGEAPRVTITEACAVHPLTAVPVIVYVVVIVGVEITAEPVELLSELEGVHT